MTKKNKMTFNQVADALMALCRTEKASAYLTSLVSASVGSYEDAQTNLAQLITRTDNPVIAMLAKKAIALR